MVDVIRHVSTVLSAFTVYLTFLFKNSLSQVSKRSFDMFGSMSMLLAVPLKDLVAFSKIAKGKHISVNLMDIGIQGNTILLLNKHSTRDDSLIASWETFCDARQRLVSQWSQKGIVDQDYWVWESQP